MFFLERPPRQSAELEAIDADKRLLSGQTFKLNACVALRVPSGACFGRSSDLRRSSRQALRLVETG